MSFDPQHSQARQSYGVAASRDEIDAGLRSYMLRVYNYMALGVAFTGIVALVVASSPALMQMIAVGPFKWVLFVGILGLGWFAPKVIFDRQLCHRTIRILGLCGDVGCPYGTDVPRIYRSKHRKSLFHNFGSLCRHEPLWLHHQKRPRTDGTVSVHGDDWNFDCDAS